MPLVTLIGEKLASEGNEFIYLGPINDCRNCKLKTVCFNLKKGRLYEIKKIRDKQHNCNVHDGRVVAAEVKEMPLFAAVDENLKEGAKSEISKIECRSIGCLYFELCNNIAIQKEKKYTVVKIYEKIECPKDKKLNKAELTDES
jgi:uncharacterized protein (UPF0179 family)